MALKETGVLENRMLEEEKQEADGEVQANGNGAVPEGLPTEPPRNPNMKW